MPGAVHQTPLAAPGFLWREKWKGPQAGATVAGPVGGIVNAFESITSTAALEEFLCRCAESVDRNRCLILRDPALNVETQVPARLLLRLCAERRPGRMPISARRAHALEPLQTGSLDSLGSIPLAYNSGHDYDQTQTQEPSGSRARTQRRTRQRQEPSAAHQPRETTRIRATRDPRKMAQASASRSIVKRSKPKPPSPPQQPLRVSLRLEEVADDVGAAALLRTILRAQARTAARRAAREPKHDAA